MSDNGNAPEQTRCQARLLRSICLRPKGGAALLSSTEAWRKTPALEAIITDEAYDLERVVDVRRNGTAREEIFWVQGHNSYHLGQIVMLREAFGVWPPPRGGDTW